VGVGVGGKQEGFVRCGEGRPRSDPLYPPLPAETGPGRKDPLPVTVLVAVG
jgi:hypothetical protein